MEFVILLIAFFDHNQQASGVKAFPTPSYQACEEVRAELMAKMAPLPDGIEVRARCLSTEQLIPSI